MSARTYPSSRSLDSTESALWVRGIEAVAALKIGASLTAIAAAGPLAASPRLWVFVAHVVTIGGVGLFLRLAGTADRRAVLLGIFLLTLATAWTDPLLRVSAEAWAWFAAPAQILRRIQIVAFAPFFFWTFIRVFPRTRPRTRPDRWGAWAARASLLLAILLAAANLLLLLPSLPAITSVASWFDRSVLTSLFWPLIFAAALPATPYAAWQARLADPGERRRVRIMLTGVLGGLAPEIVSTSLAFASPAYAEFSRTQHGRLILGAIIYPATLAIPFVVAYSVLVQSALDVRLVIRKALQYSLARYTIAALVAVPFLVLFGLIWIRREQTVSDLLSSSAGVVLLAGIVVGALLLRARHRLLDALDRRFFREQYDARRILRNLVERSRTVQAPRELAHLLAQEIDRALHLQSVETFVLARPTGGLVSVTGVSPPLGAASPLLHRLQTDAARIEIDWSRSSGWLGSLPHADQHWLADRDIRLLVPLRSADGTLLGVLALGEKKSELPFSEEDLLLLETIADSAGMALEHRLHQPAFSGSEEHSGEQSAEPARECPDCCSVVGAHVSWCEACGVPTRVAPVPPVLAGKFRFLKRIGSGGMGVVYRALDTSLGRDVAIKTLPESRAGEARRMRREARAMAAVSHPNLALIFGAESWFGAPMLVVEFLPGGTLADRLARRSLAVPEALNLVDALSPALATLHRAGFLHRDIKPTNIGFAGDGTPKLLDFGMARVLDAAAQKSGDSDPGLPTVRTGPSSDAELISMETADGVLRGTLPYLSPEAVSGAGPDESFDLWAICMVLYEAIAGRHPLLPGSPPHMALRIAEADVPDVREFNAAVPAAVAEFLRLALSPRLRDRPQSAVELRELLQPLRQATRISPS